MGSSRISRFAPDCDEDRQRQPAPLASRQAGHRLLGVRAGEQEAPEQGAGLAGREPGGALRRLQHGALLAHLLGVLREVAQLHVVTRAQLAVLERPLARQRLDQRGLAGPVRAHQGHVLAALEPQLGLVQEQLVAGGQGRALQLQHHATAARGLVEPEAQPASVARRALDPVHLVELLGARLRLARARAGAEAGHEALEALDLRLLALDGAPERQLARRLLLAPGVPGPGEVARTPGLELQHRGAHRLEEPAVVGHEDHRGVHRREPLLQPFERGDVEVVGGLVEQQQVGVARERASQRGTGELAAREGVERTVEVALVEAQPAHGGHRPLAPGVAARVLEPGLGAGVAVERAGVRGAARHPLLEVRQLLLQRQQVAAAFKHVVAQGQLALARRTLVVQRDARALRQDELAEVHRGLAGEHAQQRGLPGAVAAGERQAVTALDLERDAAQKRLARHVLTEI